MPDPTILPPFDKDKELEDLVQTMRNARPLALVGAGASVASGYPDWDALLDLLDVEMQNAATGRKQIAPKLPGILKELKDPAWQAEEFYNVLGPPHFHSFLSGTFKTREIVEEPHHLIAGLNFRHVLTTNFDPCIEVALVEAGRPFRRVYWDQPRQVQHFFADLSNPRALTAVVYLHGRFDRPKNIVLTESAFTKAYLRDDARRRITAIFMTQPVVFIGFSMTDPDLGQLMREVLACLGAGAAQQFGIFGYRTVDERDLIRRRMQGKFGLRAVFYRIVPIGRCENHAHLLDLLEYLSARTQDPPLRRRQSNGVGGFEHPRNSRAVPAQNALDPQRGRWGGRAQAAGRRVTVAQIRKIEEDQYITFDLQVEAIENAPPLAGQVKFHLHPSFGKMEQAETVSEGKATTTITAYGAFTAGVETDGDQTTLEIDLSEVEAFPYWFRAR